MVLLSGSLELHFASTQYIFHSPVLGNFSVCRLLFWPDYVFGTAMANRKVLFVFLFMKVVSGRLKVSFDP